MPPSSQPESPLLFFPCPTLRPRPALGIHVLWCQEDLLFLLHSLLSHLASDLQKLEWGWSLWKQLGEQGDGPPSTPTSIRSPGTSGLSLFSFHSSSSSSAIDFSLLPKLPLFTLFSSLKSQVQFIQTAFSCPEAKRKRKRKLQTARQSHRRRKTPKPQGKRKTQFLRKRK